MKSLHPAYLYIGNQDEITSAIEAFIKKVLCNNKGCNACINCSKIDKKQHHLVCWLEPDNQYSVSQLDVIFETIIYVLEPGEHFFFVINRADLLNVNSANRLLKSLEEPPTGYHFILTSANHDNILPTIISRCLIQNYSNIINQKSSLYRYFTTDLNNVSEFISGLEKQKILERDIIDLLDEIYDYWLAIYKKAIQENDLNLLDKSQAIIDLLDQNREYLPMPGSSKIFLKNLFLQFNLLDQ